MVLIFTQARGDSRPRRGLLYTQTNQDKKMMRPTNFKSTQTEKEISEKAEAAYQESKVNFSDFAKKQAEFLASKKVEA